MYIKEAKARNIFRLVILTQLKTQQEAQRDCIKLNNVTIK